MRLVPRADGVTIMEISEILPLPEVEVSWKYP